MKLSARRWRDARAASPRALCGLRSLRPAALRQLPWRARPPARARVRALRVAGPVAGAALRRVLGPSARLHQRPGSDRVRRSRSRLRARVEGARSPEAGASGGRPRGGSRPAADVRSACFRSRRSCARPQARRRPAARAGARAREALGASGRRRPAQGARRPTAARTVPCRAAAERARNGRRARSRAPDGRTDRRRLHVGSDRQRFRERVEACRCASRRGGHLREGGALDSVRRFARGNG